MTKRGVRELAEVSWGKAVCYASCTKDVSEAAKIEKHRERYSISIDRVGSSLSSLARFEVLVSNQFCRTMEAADVDYSQPRVNAICGSRRPD